MFNGYSFGIKNLLSEIHCSTHSSSDLLAVVWFAMLMIVLVVVYNMANI